MGEVLAKIVVERRSAVPALGRYSPPASPVPAAASEPHTFGLSMGPGDEFIRISARQKALRAGIGTGELKTTDRIQTRKDSESDSADSA